MQLAHCDVPLDVRPGRPSSDPVGPTLTEETSLAAGERRNSHEKERLPVLLFASSVERPFEKPKNATVPAAASCRGVPRLDSAPTVLSCAVLPCAAVQTTEGKSARIVVCYGVRAVRSIVLLRAMARVLEPARTRARASAECMHPSQSARRGPKAIDHVTKWQQRWSWKDGQV